MNIKSFWLRTDRIVDHNLLLTKKNRYLKNISPPFDGINYLVQKLLHHVAKKNPLLQVKYLH